MERVLSRFGGIFYAAMRVVLALIYMAHGLQKVFGMLGGHAVPLHSLLGVAGAQNVGRPPPPHVQRPGGPAKLALEQGEGQVVEAPAAEFFGNVRRIKAERFDLPLNLATNLERHVTRPFDIGFKWVELFFHKATDGVHHHLLLVGETEVHAPVTDMIRISWSSRQRSSSLTDRPLA